MNTFEDIGLNSQLLTAIDRLGFNSPKIEPVTIAEPKTILAQSTSVNSQYHANITKMYCMKNNTLVIGLCFISPPTERHYT